MSDSYTCAMCGVTFDSAWSDKEALAEMREYFGDVPEEERAVICDDCFNKIHPAEHPYEVAQAKKALQATSEAKPLAGRPP